MRVPRRPAPWTAIIFKKPLTFTLRERLEQKEDELYEKIRQDALWIARDLETNKQYSYEIQLISLHPSGSVEHAVLHILSKIEKQEKFYGKNTLFDAYMRASRKITPLKKEYRDFLDDYPRQKEKLNAIRRILFRLPKHWEPCY